MFRNQLTVKANLAARIVTTLERVTHVRAEICIGPLIAGTFDVRVKCDDKSECHSTLTLAEAHKLQFASPANYTTLLNRIVDACLGRLRKESPTENFHRWLARLEQQWREQDRDKAA